MQARYEPQITMAKRMEEEYQCKALQRQACREENDLTNPQNHIRFIQQGMLHAIRPVNRESVKVLYAIGDCIKDGRVKLRVSFEVSMGGFIKKEFHGRDCSSDSGFSSYNSKRVDFMVIDEKGNTRLVVEYNGSGHDLSGDSSDRMFVKCLALEKVCIPMIELPVQIEKKGDLSPDKHRTWAI